MHRNVKILLCLLVLLTIGLLVAVIILAHNRGGDAELPSCSDSSILKPVVGTNDLYRDLSADEIIQVRDYVLGETSLNVTPYDQATINSNYIFLIELHNPDKESAVAFLDENGPKPERVANVVIYKGGAQPPIVEELLVSLTTPMKHEVNTLLTMKPIPFNSRPQDKLDYKQLHVIVKDFTTKVHKLLYESYDGYTLHNCTNRCLTYAEIGPGTVHRSGERQMWVWFMRGVPGNYLHPVGLELLVQREGTDMSRWKIEKIYYNRTLFDSVEELLQAYENGTVKVFLKAPTEEELSFSSLKRRGDKLQPSVPLREPKQYEPDGKRYTASDNHIEYMGWSFDFRVRTTSGVQLFNIKFKGERIVYELSLQEAGAFYGGYSPKPSYTGYLDTTWALGTTHELVKDVDCPAHATFFDVIFFVDGGQPAVRRNGICVFELNTGTPLRRHHESDYKGSYLFYGGVIATTLTVRTVVTAYNYDYVYDYIFYPNGVIETKVSATGYIQASLWTPEEGEYSSQVYETISGNIHDHLINFKVDLDVGGRKNSYETLSAVIENITDRWYLNERHIQKRVVRETKTTEKDAAYKFNFQRPSYLNFYNPSQKDSKGVPRGYRIQLNGMMYQLYPDNFNYTNAFHWSFYQMAVTKYKKTEERSSCMYNQNNMFEPVVNFRKFLEDDENIVNEDLVSWVTVGFMHIPHMEDMPNTATAGNSGGFFIRPYNYFSEDPSMSSRDSVLITPTKDGSKVDRPGRPTGTKCIPQDKPIKFSGRDSLDL